MSSSGAGRSAVYARRISTISAAADGLGASATSSRPLSSICQARARIGTDRRSPSAAARARSSLDRPSPAAEAPSVLARVVVCTASARSARIWPGSAPSRCRPASSSSAAPAAPPISCSNRSKMRPRSASPSMARTLSVRMLPAPMASAWSSSDRPSRTEPCAARAISASASSSAVAPSLPAMPLKCATSAGTSTRRRSKRCVRDSTVTGTLRTSVVAKMNFTCSGGSSSVFRSALKAPFESMCTSSIRYTL